MLSNTLNNKIHRIQFCFLFFFFFNNMIEKNHQNYKQNKKYVKYIYESSTCMMRLTQIDKIFHLR